MDRPTLVVALLLAVSAAFAEWPALQGLRGASRAPAQGAGLEAQSAQAGHAFTANASPPAVSADVRAGPAGADPVRPPAALGKALRRVRVAPRPELSDGEVKTLKIVRATGVVAAAGGLGLFGYAIAAGATGPIGWAAALVFFGGLGAYLAHRRLKGKSDFA